MRVLGAYTRCLYPGELLKIRSIIFFAQVEGSITGGTFNCKRVSFIPQISSLNVRNKTKRLNKRSKTLKMLCGAANNVKCKDIERNPGPSSASTAITPTTCMEYPPRRREIFCTYRPPSIWNIEQAKRRGGYFAPFVHSCMAIFRQGRKYFALVVLTFAASLAEWEYATRASKF